MSDQATPDEPARDPDYDRDPRESLGPLRQRAADLVDRATVWMRGTILDDLLEEIRRTRIFDLSYTLAAQAFVALIPLVLVITASVVAPGDSSAVGDNLSDRLDLSGAARDAVQTLFRSPGSGSGVYWLGLLITLYSAFALSRRVSRAYTTLWRVPRLGVGQQWRGLVWVLLQVGLTIAATWLRTLGAARGVLLELVALVALLGAWAGGEYLAQLLLTAGQVTRRRLWLGAGLITVGRAGVLVWSGLYLPSSLARQAELYGPIGVVFGLFTWIFASAVVLVLGTLLAAVLTARPVSTWFVRSTGTPSVGNVGATGTVTPA